jgi:hypothetical protein
MQSAENTGVGGGSGALGSTGALGTLTGSNVANLSATSKISAGIGATQQSAADAQQTGAMWGAIGQTSGSIFSAAGGFEDAFDTGTGTPVKGGWQSEVFTT